MVEESGRNWEGEINFFVPFFAVPVVVCLFMTTHLYFLLGRRGGLLFKVCKMSCIYTISHPSKLSMLYLDAAADLIRSPQAGSRTLPPRPLALS